MYKSSSTKYIRSENPVFRWGYLMKSTSVRVRKFRMMARSGVPQSEWCSTLGRGVNEAIAPPQRGVQYNG